MGAKINREGEIKSSKYGGEMLIVTYNTRVDILVKFLDHNNIVHTNYSSFENGNVVSPYHKTVYNIGFIGEGKHKVSENRKLTHKYKTWHGMMRRCYSKGEKNKFSAYKDVSVCNEWHCFQNFGDWYDNNFYQIEGELMALDKDIKVKGNKVYSPNTCVFVPSIINSLFVIGNSKKDDLPIGVIFNDRYKVKKYIARCGNREGKTVSINTFKTPEEAFNAYKKYKEFLIKDIANEYKDRIPDKLYNAMINYKVEIND